MNSSKKEMATAAEEVREDELLDYEENEEEATVDVTATKKVKGSYVSIHSSGFRDFLLKPELLRAIVDCGFEHPSEGKYYFMTKYITNFIYNNLNTFLYSTA